MQNNPHGRTINYEKISAYLAGVVLLHMFWQSQMDTKSEICEAKIEIVSNQKDIERLEEKLNAHIEGH